MFNTHNDSGIASGQKSTWTLLKKLGEGDAGEVYLVESLSDGQSAILKRPQRSVFSGDVRRQAEQIRMEGRILQTLENLLQGAVKAPALLDQSKPGSEFSERYFIVIAQAPGFDLSSLARVAFMGLHANPGLPASPQEQAFLQEIARSGQLPERILLQALSAVFETFKAIHDIPPNTPHVDAVRILWNDVKPDHLFWDPHQACFTIIDWGNGQMLEAAPTGRGLQQVPAQDQRQLIEEMNRFIEQAAPGLLARLEWPVKTPPANELPQVCDELAQRVNTLLTEKKRALVLIRQEEARLLTPGPDAGAALLRLEELYQAIMGLGEIPDFAGALTMVSASIEMLAENGSLDAIQRLCAWAAALPGTSSAYWLVLSSLARTALSMPEAMQPGMLEAVKLAAARDWDGVLWAMLNALQSLPEPQGWFELVQEVRQQAAGSELNNLPPLLALRRLNLALQANAQQMEDRLVRHFSAEEDQTLQSLNRLVETLQEIIQNWIQVDPLPPHASLVYSDIEALIPEIEANLPGSGMDLLRALEPPRSLMNQLMEAWGRKEFVNVGRGLRRLLVLDPDRRRLLHAEHSIQAASDWLQSIQVGPQAGVHLSEFVTDLEYEGRDLRNRVGPAGWLDGILEGLKTLRQGTWPGDLVSRQPVLLAEMPWLRRFVRAEVLTSLLKPDQAPLALPAIQGVRDTRFGPDGEIAFIEPLDAWMPEVRGSSARVYLGFYKASGGEQREAAIKVMRMDKQDYAKPLFREEVRVLKIMEDVPGVAHMLECGFMWLTGSEEGKMPSDQNISAIQALRGDVLRFGPDATEKYLSMFDARVQEGWTPYLLIEKKRKEDCLLLWCDSSVNHGRFLPVPDLLFMCIQICDILEAAHQRGVVYRDHKILHYYWLADQNGITYIDWNVARFHPEGLTPYDIHMDLVQLGARGLHHILTGRPAPGALPLGPTRPEEIEQAAQSYAAQWTYDDQRLSPEVRSILEQLLSGAYTSVSDLKADLKQAYMNLTPD